MELPLKANCRSFALLTVAGVVVSCSGPKAMIYDRGGNSMSVKDVQAVDAPLEFRFAGGVTECSFKTIGVLKIESGTHDIYAGQTWIRASIMDKKSKEPVFTKGWVKQLSRIEAEAMSGKSQFNLSSIKMIDFTMKYMESDSTKPETAPVK